MTITHLVADRLSDGRVQIFASKSDGTVWSLWKTSTDPDSAWTPWQRFDSNTPQTSVVGSGLLSNGAIQLFGLAAMPAWPIANVTRWKASGHPDDAWTGWVGLGFDGNCIAVTAQRLTDKRMQIFALSEETPQGRIRFLSRWKTTVAPDAPLSAIAEMTPPGPGLTSLVALRLSDDRIQLLGGTNDSLLTTWKQNVNADAAWQPWMDFPANPTVRSTARLAWAPLPDRRPQIWSVNRFGQLSSCWKVSVNPNDAWVPWVTLTDAPANLVDVAAQPLSDGRIQVFVTNQAGALFSTWKVTTHPDAAWQPWQPFPGV